MSKEPTNTDFPAGDFISENAVRAVFGRRRPASPPTPAHGANGMPKHSSAAGADPSPAPSGPRRLRRWSVAELLARAVVLPPSTT
jgi:hypothetical protein